MLGNMTIEGIKKNAFLYLMKKNSYVQVTPYPITVEMTDMPARRSMPTGGGFILDRVALF